MTDVQYGFLIFAVFALTYLAVAAGRLPFLSVDRPAAALLSVIVRQLKASRLVVAGERRVCRRDSRVAAGDVDHRRVRVELSRDQLVGLQDRDDLRAAYAEASLTIADGQVVDELRHPTRESVLEKMGKLTARAMR